MLVAQQDDRLGAHQPVLGAAERDRVDAGVGGQRPQRHAERGGGVAQPGAVDVQQHPVRVRPLGQGGDRLRRVDGSELGALGDRDHPRLDDVLVPDPHAQRRDQLRRQPPVGRVDHDQLAAGALGRAALVDVQVRGARAHPPSQGRVNAATHSTLAPVPLNTGNACAAGPKCSRKRSCAGGPRVGAVGGRVALVGGRDRGDDLGMDAGVVVAGEAAALAHGYRPATARPRRSCAPCHRREPSGTLRREMQARPHVAPVPRPGLAPPGTSSGRATRALERRDAHREPPPML